MATPKVEQHPEGLDLHWAHVWDNALRTMKDQGTWSMDLRPLLDEYVWALMAARSARESAEETAWDRHSKRATKLADVLVLTPEARKRNGIHDGEDDAPQKSVIEGLAERRLRAV